MNILHRRGPDRNGRLRHPVAAPFLLAALGETLGQRSGVHQSGRGRDHAPRGVRRLLHLTPHAQRWLAVLVGMGVGAALGLVTALVSVTLKAEQGISGIGVYLFALGFSEPPVPQARRDAAPDRPAEGVAIPLLHRIPTVGGMFFEHDVLVYVAFLLVPVVAFVLGRTTYGHERQGGRREPCRRRQPRRERHAYPLLGRDRRQHARRSRRRDAADPERHLPAEPDPERRGSSPSRSSTSARGGRWA